MFSRFKKSYDYIIIDCMPSLGMITVNVLASADRVIITVQTHYLALKGMGNLLSTISSVRKHLNPDLQVGGVLLTLVDNRTNLAKEIKEELVANYGNLVKIFNTQIPIAIKAAESASQGKSIFSYDKNSKVAEAYSSFAKELIKDETNKTKAVSTSIKAIIAGTKPLIAILTAGSSVVGVIIISITLVALLVGSIFGIFFSGYKKNSNSITMDQVVSECHKEFSERIQNIQDTNPQRRLCI